MAARFNANGTLDRTFGGRGYSAVAFARGAESSMSLSLQPDGAIVVGGYGDDRRDNLAYVLTRFEMSGAVDTSFGHGGRVVTSFRREAILFDTVVQPDGRIIAAGSSPKGFGIVRYLRDGSRDPSFGRDGRVETRGGSDPASIALQADGKLLAVGYSAHDAFLVIRYLTS